MKRLWSNSSLQEGSVMIWAAITITVLVGVTGLAMDAGQMFVVRQKAQAAADSAVLAGVLDMYNGTTTGGGTYGTTTTCSATSNWTPCYYARQNGFGGSTGDTVTVDFSASGGTSQTCKVPSGLGGSLASENPSVICVTVSRLVNTTLMRAMGQNNSTVSATAIAAIVLGPAPLPIVVTHPHLVDAFQSKGGATVTITGGPSRAIQINSDGTIDANGKTANTPEAFQVSGNSSINLSTAGPSSSGADFRSWGPAYSQDTTASITTGSVSGSCPTWLCIGNAHYVDPASIITDPLQQLTQPAQPSTNGTVTNVASGAGLGVSGCSAKCTAAGGCQIYTPGLFTGGIQVKGNSQVTAYFYPGLYYISDAKGNNNFGFQTGPNGDMEMLSSVCTVSKNAGTDSGMVVFNTSSQPFSVGANGAANLSGPSLTNSIYAGILFWQDRTATTGLAHQFGGGGSLTLTGTIYANMLNSSVTSKNYQSVTLSGNSGNTTQIIGEVITNVLTLGGKAAINMQLSTQQVQNARQIALVQ